MATDETLDTLVEALVSPKAKDGTWNKLIKTKHREDTNEYQINIDSAYRAGYTMQLQPPPGYIVATDANGWLIPTDIDEILSRAYLNSASDVHIAVGAPPKMRWNGDLKQMPYQILTPQMTKALLQKLLDDTTLKFFDNEGDIDFAYSIPGMCRFRVNMFKQRGTWGAVFRALSNSIPRPDELGIPKAVQELTTKKRGLVLVTGPTGQGKSTTLASLIDVINHNREANIVTIEDPIEYLHQHNNSHIVQREVGGDTKSFAAALRAALREDPDVILVGEMRDPETIATAITAAETGHLVFSTLHTIGAGATIDRIIDSFPESQQNQVRSQLTTVLQAVISQQLVPMADGSGRAAAFEVMIANSAIRNLIRENKIAQIDSAIQTGRNMGMITMDESLKQLYYNGIIDRERAIEFAINRLNMENGL